MLTLSTQELVTARFLLHPKMRTDLLGLICDDLDYAPLSPSWDNVQRHKQIKDQVPTHDYALYPELCVGCLTHTGAALSDQVRLECLSCYNGDPYYKGAGYYRIQNLSLLLGLAPYGMEFTYLSQIIYQTLQVQPHVTYHNR